MEAAAPVPNWTSLAGVLQQRVSPVLVRAKAARLLEQTAAQWEEKSQREAGVQ